MSVLEGKKAFAAIEAFNAAYHGAERTPMELIARVLQKRELGEKHFQQAYEYLSAMHKSAAIKVVDNLDYNPTSRLQDRSLISFLLYMGIAAANGKVSSYDEYVPAIISSRIHPNLLSFTSRAIPITFSSQHTEFRFIQRTGERMDYANDDSQWAMITGLMMAISLPLVMAKTNTNVHAVALPFSNGFYLGHAALVAPDTYYPVECLLSVGAKGGQPALLHGITKDGARVKTEPDWSPHSTLRINTFVSQREFHADQKALYETFSELFRNPATADAYNSLINSYANMLPTKKDDSRRISWLIEQFERIYASPEWSSVTKYAQKHLPAHVMS